MTNQEILEKAIQKAIDGGWTGGKELNFGGDWMGSPPKLEVVAVFSPELPRIMYTSGGVNSEVHYYPPTLPIFDHDFAKALWGDEDTPYAVWCNRQYAAGAGGPDEDWYDGQLWEFHLQQMVLAEDPIKYLGENI